MTSRPSQFLQHMLPSIALCTLCSTWALSSKMYVIRLAHISKLSHAVRNTRSDSVVPAVFSCNSGSSTWTVLALLLPVLPLPPCQMPWRPLASLPGPPPSSTTPLTPSRTWRPASFGCGRPSPSLPQSTSVRCGAHTTRTMAMKSTGKNGHRPYT